MSPETSDIVDRQNVSTETPEITGSPALQQWITKIRNSAEKIFKRKKCSSIYMQVNRAAKEESELQGSWVCITNNEPRQVMTYHRDRLLGTFAAHPPQYDSPKSDTDRLENVTAASLTED